MHIFRPLTVALFATVGLTSALLSISSSGTAQPPSCGETIRLALQTADSACQSIGRNQACYGNSQGEVVSRPDTSAEWESVGDTVNLTDIQGFSLSPLDDISGDWGVAIMQAQANLPDTAPGQNVTMVVFGDVVVEDAVTDQARVTGETTATVNVRLSPEVGGAVLGTLSNGADVIVTGLAQNRAGETWLRIQYDEYRTRTGWVFADFVSVDRAALPTVPTDSLVYNPMQAFYLKPGIGAPQCAEVPTDGVIIQTPNGVGMVNLNINGVDIALGSTAFLSLSETETGQMLGVTLLEGNSIVRSFNDDRILIPGSHTSVMLDDDGSPTTPPSEATAYDPAELDSYAEQLARMGVELPEPAVPVRQFAPPPPNPSSPPNGGNNDDDGDDGDEDDDDDDD
ncbi:MAG: SH3 domain-containing protein [Anaerolineae bacterium]|jgi:hypothetical protein|nr:SH3 domain-containing protein [Anaerolineae bacterium]